MSSEERYLAGTAALAAEVGEPAARFRAEVERPPRIGVVVCHGMGQQLPFETLGLVAEALRKREWQRDRRSPRITTRIVDLPWSDERSPSADRLHRKRLPRVELTIPNEKGQEREVHLYESYWAPLTEGQVSSADVVGFLLGAGVNGLLGLRKGVFERHLFGRWHAFGVKPYTLVALFGAAFAVFGAFLLVNAVIIAVAAGRLVAQPATGWPSQALLADLTIDVALFLGVLLLAAIITGLTHRWHDAVKANGGHWSPPNLLLLPARLSVVVALIGTVLVAALMAYHLGLHQTKSAAQFWSIAPWPDSPTAGWIALELAFWSGAYALAAKARWFFVQYLGDVAAYLSSHELNRFFELREKIKGVSADTARAVYGARDDKLALAYDRLIVVGHSLGSVVAYDTLNGLINDDALNHRVLQVVARTELLLTFGSPLDKTAFVFRTQSAGRDDVREALAAARQPLIVHHANRPRAWTNIYAEADWISASVDYYDTPIEHEAERWSHPRSRVENVRDPEALTPLLAHNEYWTNDLFAERLHGAIVN